eukprot:m.183261 g.183261  ORF g.183261 m.183261 type:complete len:308 (-) comp53495_c0_seq2:18-941(-)
MDPLLPGTCFVSDARHGCGRGLSAPCSRPRYRTRIFSNFRSQLIPPKHLTFRDVWMLGTTEQFAWSQPAVRGSPPSLRHGHIMCAVGPLVLVHGGMNGPLFFHDLHVFDTESNAWRRQECTGDVPNARSGHAAAVIGSHVIIFGGLAFSQGGPVVFDDVRSLNTATWVWSHVKVTTEPVNARLDHQLTTIQYPISSTPRAARSAAMPVPVPVATTKASTASADSGNLLDVTSMFGVGSLDSTSSTTTAAAATATTTEAVAEQVAAIHIAAPSAASSSEGTVTAVVLSCGMDLDGNIFDDYLLLVPEL